MEMAKSKAWRGCGSCRRSATRTECGAWDLAMVTRFWDLGTASTGVKGKERRGGKKRGDETYLSEARMKILRLTERYLPLPQPTSRPMELSGNSLRKRSIIGQGW